MIQEKIQETISVAVRTKRIRRLPRLNESAQKETHTRIWAAKDIILGRKHSSTEKTEIYDPDNWKLFMDPDLIMKATLNYKVKVITKNPIKEEQKAEVVDKGKLHIGE